MSDKSIHFNYEMVSQDIKCFTGEEGVNIKKWIKEIKFLSKVFELSEVDTKRIVLSKLNGRALDWAYNLMESNDWNIELQDLYTQLENRFKDHDVHSKIYKFIKHPEVKTRDEYLKLLEDANELHESDVLNLPTLGNIIVMRAPGIMRTAIYTELEKHESWYQLLGALERFATVLDSRDKCKGERRSEGGRVTNCKKFCDLHGNGNHSTDVCFRLSQLRHKGWSRRS